MLGGQTGGVSDTVVVALIVGVVGPSVMWGLTDWQRRRDRAAEWARQDRMAAAAAADRIAVAEKLETIEKTGAVTHELVNSRFRETKQRQLESTTRELASLRALAVLQQAQGAGPSEEDQAIIDDTVVAIEDLRREIASIDAKTEVANRL